MSETAPQDDAWNIDRTHSPEKVVNLGGYALRLTYANTSVYRFKQPWDMIDHVFRVNDGGRGGTFIFDSNELCNDLTDMWFPTHLMPYPPDGDITAYRNYQHQKLEAELQQFGEEQ